MPKTYAELLREARTEIREVTAAEADALRQSGGVVLLDVREASEWDQGHVTGARHVSKSYVEMEVEAALPDKSTPVVLYCAGGIRSLFAAQTMRDMGYTDVASMKGGFQAWKGQGLEWSQPARLTDAQRQRYSRHLLIPEVGSEGQAKLLAVEGAADRRGRPRVAGRPVPRRRGRRDDRDHRLRRRRHVQPPAPGPAHLGPGGREEGRVGAQDAHGAQPGRDGRRPSRRCWSRTTSSG